LFCCDTKVKLKKPKQGIGNRRNNIGNCTTKGAGDHRIIASTTNSKITKKKRKIKRNNTKTGAKKQISA
jgi:hypothetical protein